jgi:hypothetical protein
MKKGRRSAVTVQIVKGTLDRAALKSIYTQCNDALHRGDLKRVLGGAPKVFDIDILEQWIIEIGRTLSRHVIFIPDFGNALVVDMTAGPDSTVSVATVGDVRPFFG